MYRGLIFRYRWVRVFFEVIRRQITTFQMIAGSSSIFLKCIWNKSCSWAALLKFWFRTDLGRENSTGFYMQGRQSLLTFLPVTRWSRFTSNFYALIGQNLTGEFMRKIYAASGNVFTHSWSWQSFVSSCDVFNCLFLLNVQNELQLLSRFFCNSWFVYCTFHAPLVKVIGNTISDGIVFNKELTHLPLFEALEGWKVSSLSWWPSGAASRLVSLSNYCFWCVCFPVSLSRA